MGLLTLTPTDKKAFHKARKLGMVGDDGLKDTELVQMNRHEVSLLPQVLGTPAKINPRTGLLSFAEGGGPGSGSSGRSGGGQSGGGGGGPGGGGGMGHDPGHGGANPGAQGGGRSTGPTGPAGGGGLGPSGIGPLGPGFTDMDGRGFLDGGWGKTNTNATISKENVGKMFDPSNETPGYYGAKPPTPGFVSRLGNTLLGGFGMTVNPNAAQVNGVPTNTVTVDPIGMALGVAGTFNPAVNMAALGYNRIGKPLGIQGPTVTVGPSLPGEHNGQSPSGTSTDHGGNNTGTAADPYRVYTGNVSQTTPQQYAANTGLLQLTQPGQMIGGVWQPPYSYYAWG